MNRILLLISFLIFNHANAQKLTIEFEYKNASQIDSLTLGLRKPYPESLKKSPEEYQIQSIKYFKTDSIGSATYVFDVKDTSCSLVEDMFGHEMILIPNDTAKIFVTRLSDLTADHKLNGQFMSPWMLNFSYSGKNKYIYALFDSLAYHTGAVHSDMVQSKGKTVAEFMLKVEERYQNRINYLNEYCKKYAVSPSIHDLVKAEIYAAYVQNLLFLYFRKNYFPDVIGADEILRTKIDVAQLNKGYFFKTLLTQETIYQYLVYNESRSNAVSFNQKELVDIYEKIKKDYKGEVKNRLLTEHIVTFINNSPLKLDSILTVYHQDCKNIENKLYIDSLVKLKASKKTINFNALMQENVSDLEGKLVSLKSISNNQLTLIDCWASWCTPCIAEFGSAKKLEKLYAEKMNFVYLSFDKSNTKWKEKAKELNMGNHNYVIPGNFSSDFAAYFKIFSIPRYILIGKDGKLIDADTYRPSNVKLTEKIDVLLAAH